MVRMRTLATIPIKSNSVRVKGKNFRPLGGKKLYEYILGNALDSGAFDDVLVDTDSQEIVDYCSKLGVRTTPREEWLASNEANGNDLLVSHMSKFPGYDAYFQLFATAPFLSKETIKGCVDFLSASSEHDSILTATEEIGWFWIGGVPVNFRPGILPRSQDAPKVIKETTGLYGIKRNSLDRYRCRVGSKPYFYMVSQDEAVDLDTEDDFRTAEIMLERGS